MSYVRSAQVYAWSSNDDHFECWLNGAQEGFRCTTPEEMLAYFCKLLREGYRLPDEAFIKLKREIEEARLAQASGKGDE